MARPKKQPDIQLSEEQRVLVRERWDKDDLLDLTQQAFGDDGLDINSPQVKAVRAFIASLDGSAEPTKPKAQQGPELTEEQKANIRALITVDDPPSVRELFKLIWPDLPLKSTLQREYQLLFKYVQEVNSEAVDIWDEPVAERRYKAPVSYSSFVGIVNRHVGNPQNPNKALYDLQSLKKSQENNLKALWSYLQTNQFVLQASQYDKKADRNLFEETFIRQVHDKGADLIPEEVDMYMAVAAETVEISKMERDIRRYEGVVNKYLEDNMDGEKKSALSKPFVDALTALRVKFGESKKRRKDLIDSVAGSRKDRVANKTVQTDALVNLLNLWAEEQTRNDLIALGKKEHEDDKKEWGRIKSLDDSIALIAGMSEEDAIHGL